MHEPTTNPPIIKVRRRFTPQDKLQILKEWEATGNGIEVAQKHKLHPPILYRWKKALEQGAQVFLSSKEPRHDPRIRQLEAENRKLKEALGTKRRTEKGDVVENLHFIFWRCFNRRKPCLAKPG